MSTPGGSGSYPSKLQAYSTDWVNGKEAGLIGDGVANDGLLIQSILNALPPGGTLFLPPGAYATKQTIFVPQRRRIIGTGSPRWHYTSKATCVIRAQTPWKTGDNAVLKIADETINPFGVPSDGVELAGFLIDHSPLKCFEAATPDTTVHGIFCEGLVRSIRLDDIAVAGARGNAFRFSKGASTRTGGVLPRGIEANRLRSVDNCRKEHFFLAGTTDSIFTDCLAAAGSGTGFYMLNPAETKIVASRAVFTGGVGFHVDGDNNLTQLQLIGPSTDRNKLGALLVTSTGTRPITISSPLWSRDSSDGVSPAVWIKGAQGKKANPVIIDGQVMMPGVNDDGSGLLTPRVGMRVENASILRATGMVWGVETTVEDIGGHSSDPVLPEFRRQGTADAPEDHRAGGAQSVETVSRESATSSAISMGTTVLRLTALPGLTERITISTLRFASGATAAGATPTSVQLGVYRERADGALELVGSTANDPTLLAVANTVYDKPLQAPIELNAGTRYFIGLLVVSSAAAPSVAGMGSPAAALMASSPRLCAQVNGKMTLPAVVATSEMTQSGSLVYIKAS